MQFLFRTILNALIFYFVVSLFKPGILIAGGENLSANLLIGILFGLVMGSVPFILGFFKFPNSVAGNILVSLVLIFLFFFALSTGFAGLGGIAPTVISLGAGLTFVLPTSTQTMVAATIVTAIIVVGMENLRKKV